MRYNREIISHVSEIDRCNQRGGRFLSTIDLLEAGTVDLELASYLGSAILQGNSFLVGAVPGGAGKTTVMGAFLNFVPPGVELQAATEGVPPACLSSEEDSKCLICHEVGQGPYFAYLWGRDVVDLFKLTQTGNMVATNLHADDVEQTRSIVCEGCGVSEELFSKWPLFVFLRVKRRSFLGGSRRISTVWEGPSRLIYRDAGKRFEKVSEPEFGDPESRGKVKEILETLSSEGKRTLEEVRASVLDSFGKSFQG